MPGTSEKSVAMGIRLPVEVARKVKENAEKKGVTVSSYIAKIVGLQVMRKR